jgi:hypothetical protein
VYITSFVHREELFNMVQRWLCDRLEPSDGMRLTQILICDGFILGETLDAITRLLLSTFSAESFRTKRLHFKGELRDIICRSARTPSSRSKELIESYMDNPEFFYTEAPVDGTAYLDGMEKLLAIYRIKRPRRIAEKRIGISPIISSGWCRIELDKWQRNVPSRSGYHWNTS